MITGFIVLLVCQLVGNFTVDVLDVPVPGPVVGMVLLLVVLLVTAGTGVGTLRLEGRFKSRGEQAAGDTQ